MELQRHASILIRQSNELLKLTGNYDSGAHNDQAIREQIATMHDRLNDLAALLTPEPLVCHQCHKPIDSLHTHTENGVKHNYCSYCYRAQFD
ncbi:MAG TPA: hypothetical protein VEL31_09785 [Ktedonobacteraceae bacterium]|nr:hypothetical protein [Ktedonobacteraceae bacterium]